MISLLPPLTVADLGAGEGTLSQLLAKKARKVIAIDNAPKMVEFGSQLAKKHGFKNLDTAWATSRSRRLKRTRSISRSSARPCITRSIPSVRSERRTAF